MLPRMTHGIFALVVLVATLLTGHQPGAGVGTTAVTSATPRAGTGHTASVPGPPRNHATRAQMVVQQVFVTTKVDSDRDGQPDVVRVLIARPPAGMVKGRKLSTVGRPSPYFSCCRPLRSSIPGTPLAGQHHTPRLRDLILQDFDKNAREWVDSGYAYARIAALGTNGSTGCVTMGGPAETAGTTAFIDWLNGRAVAHDGHGKVVSAPWSNGKVGLVGESYDGTLANEAAATGVPGLKAIVPLSGISSWYDFFRQGGLDRFGKDFDGVEADNFARFIDTRAGRRACDKVISSIARLEDRRTGDYNAFWADRNARARASRVHAAVLIAHGFSDHDVQPSQAADWYADLRRAGVPVQIWWDQGGHGITVPDWLVHRWFDHYLYGVDDIDQGGRAWIASADGHTTRYADWPRPGSRPVAHRLGADGTTATFSDDPSLDATTECARPDPAHSVTVPLPGAGLDLSGSPTARMHLTFDRPSANLTVALCVVDGTRSTLLTEGWADPQNHSSILHGKPLVPGRGYDVDVDLQPIDETLPAGASLALVVMSSDHPYTLRPKAGTEITVALGESTVSLPVVG